MQTVRHDASRLTVFRQGTESEGIKTTNGIVSGSLRTPIYTRDGHRHWTRVFEIFVLFPKEKKKPIAILNPNTTTHFLLVVRHCRVARRHAATTSKVGFRNNQQQKKERKEFVKAREMLENNNKLLVVTDCCQSVTPC